MFWESSNVAVLRFTREEYSEFIQQISTAPDGRTLDRHASRATSAMRIGALTDGEARGIARAIANRRAEVR